MDYHEPVAKGYGLPLPRARGGEGAERHAEAAGHRRPAGQQPGTGAGVPGTGACGAPVSFHLHRGQLQHALFGHGAPEAGTACG